MPALITSTAGSKENLDEAIDPMGVCVTCLVGAGTPGEWITGCGDTAYFDAGPGRADASCFGSLRCPLQTAPTTHSDPNHPTYFHANPSPYCDNRPKPDGNSNSNSSGNGNDSSNSNSTS